MEPYVDCLACNELMVQECIKELRQNDMKVHNFIAALLNGYTVSYHGYQFTDYDTRRIYDAVKKGRNY
ncbi:MAG: hypothetical protein NC218_07190 [Acetobacter sp.]|nr:hypothetical protein [Acetobacter sp.]